MKDPKRVVGMKLVGDFGRQLHLTKRIETAKLVKHNGFIVLIHDNSKLILVQLS
jgi:hypothetical protein